MSAPTEFSPPLLVVVSGAPASGKTTIAEQLAKRLRLPMLTKDTFKERLYETIGSGDEVEDAVERAALGILYSAADMQLDAGVSVMVESNFDSRSDLGPLRRLHEKHGTRLVQIHCTRAKEKLLERFVGRIEEGARHPGHGDDPDDVEEVERKLDEGVWDPLDLLGQLVQVDKDAEGFSYDDVARQVRALSERAAAE